jgi:hypothetical protein
MAGELARPIGETNYGHYGKDSTMASMGLSPINLQDSPDDTTAADEAYDREVSARLDHERITDYFVDLVGSALMKQGVGKTLGHGENALADMRQLLSGAPLQDAYDLAEWAKVGQPSDAALAHLVRKLYGMAHLAEVERIRGELGNIAF